MHDIRPGDMPEPNQPPRPEPRMPDVNLHPDYAGRAPQPDVPPAAPTQPTPPPAQPDWTSAPPTAQPMRDGSSYEVSGVPPVAPPPEPAPVPPAAGPPADEHLHRNLAHSLRTIKFGLIGLVVLLAAATFFFLTQGTKPDTSSQSQSGNQDSAPVANDAGDGKVNSVSCIGQTGPDASTDSQTFKDIDGTQCTYRSGPTAETLVLNGKLTGRNTEGTGMSVSINVNGKVCSGGESLNYARTYTPMVSNCVFEVPANSAVAIKWQFLSPFGGSASVLRSSKNIAPSITGVAIPKPKDDSRG